MKTKIALIVLSSFLTMVACDCECGDGGDKEVDVAVFQGDGGASSCIRETVAALNLDKEFDVSIITSADIAAGALSELDAIVIPGGSGKRQFFNLGAENQTRIKEFVKNGGGIVGICAGAYMLSETPGYPCMEMNGASAIDIEHDNRGRGMAKFTMNELGKEIFHELSDEDTSFVYYYEGPVYVKNDSSVIEFTQFATMESDVHQEGNAPSDMTNNRPFFIGNEYGKGRVFSSIAHPEATPGKSWMIPRMVRWTLRMPYTPYSSVVTTPPFEPKELLMNSDFLSYEDSLINIFLYGSSEDKIKGVDWMEYHYSWSGEDWAQGLLFDSSSQVRLRAAQYLGDMLYTPYYETIKSAYMVEKDDDVKSEMRNIVEKLKNLK